MNSIIIFCIVIGLFTIGFGFLIVRFPKIPGGYNMITREELIKQNVDLHALARISRNHLCLMGGTIVIVSFILEIVGLAKWTIAAIVIAMLTGCIMLSVSTHKYLKNTLPNYTELHKQTKSLYWGIGVFLFILLGIGVFIGWWISR